MDVDFAGLVVGYYVCVSLRMFGGGFALGVLGVVYCGIVFRLGIWCGCFR